MSKKSKISPVTSPWFMLQGTFVTLKLVNAVDWNWWVVFIPSMFLAAYWLIVFVLALILVIYERVSD